MKTAGRKGNQSAGFKTTILLLLILCIMGWSFFGVPAESRKAIAAGENAGTDGNVPEKNIKGEANAPASAENSYAAVSGKYDDPSNYQLSGKDRIVLKAANAFSDSGKPVFKKEEAGRDSVSVCTDEKTEAVSWDFEVNREGLYEIGFEYLTDAEEGSQVQREIWIDHELPFTESGNIAFPRRWYEASKVTKDINGDEVNPLLKQQNEWFTVKATDVDGYTSEPFRYYLENGKHTLTLVSVSGKLSIGEISLIPAEDYPKYREVLKEYKEKDFPEYKGESVVLQGEDADYRSEQILRREYNSDPATQPYQKGQVVLNTIGGYNWRNANQKIEWDFYAPESALYKLNLKVFQNHGEGLNVYRQIAIDGVVPFEEVKEYPLSYSDKWQSVTVSDGKGKPYLFYLSEGKHRISLENKLGKSGYVAREIYSINEDMSTLLRNITKVTGSDPDPNFQYELDEKVPKLMDTMADIRDRYRHLVDYLIKISGKTPTLANSLNTAADQLDYLIRKPEKIPKKLRELTTTQSSLSTYAFEIQEQPATIDFLQFATPEKEIKLRKSTLWERAAGTMVNFASSFYKDYDSVLYSRNEAAAAVNQVEVQEQKPVVLDVWVARTKEMGEIIQRLANEDFSTKTGIAVKVNILPAGSVGAVGSVSPLMLSIISGNAPDVALGSDQSTPVELAIRGATRDLSKFSDFDEIRKRFLPEALTPLEYRGGVYALPETMDFSMMFYRKDILEEIGMDVPQTWDDLYYTALPILKQNALDFYMPSDYSPFLYQNGGEYYNADRSALALDSDAAYKAFLQWTENYTIYDIPKTVDVYNHFRIGDVPLVIGGYGDFIKLTYAAPDIYGKWGVTNIPGILQEDGTMDRSNSGAISTICMFSDSDKKEEAWEFAKWWSSAEIQERFSMEVEAVIGLEARWNSANTEAFLSLPWPKEDLPVFREAWDSYKGVPNALGGYYTSRHISNAWTRVVMDGMNPRESLEKAIKAVNIEMKRKQVEYGLEDGQDPEE